MGKIGFDNEKYLSEQTTAILDRVKRFGNKLYLEFGGKLLYDFHAAGAAGLRPQRQNEAPGGIERQSRHPSLHFRRRYRAQKDAGRLRDHLRFGRLKMIDDLRTWGIQIVGS